MNVIPRGWQNSRLADVCETVTKINPLDLGRSTFRYVDIGSIDPVRHAVSQLPDGPVQAAPARARQLLQAGDTVFSTVRPYLLKIAWIPDALTGEIASTGFCVLRPKRDLVDPRFMFHFATSGELLNQVLPLQRGVSYPAVRDRDVMNSTISFPHVDEQRHIVSVLEEYLSRLDDSERALDLVRGKSRTLLASLRNEALRLGPANTPLAEVADIQGGIQKQPKRRPVKNIAPFLRVANVTASGLDLGEVHQIELFDGERERFSLARGDLLVVEGNGSPSQIGRAAIWDGSIEGCVHQNHLIRIRASQGLCPEYLEVFWNAPATRRMLSEISSSTSGLHTLSVRKLSAIRIPVPPQERQEEFVSRYREASTQIIRLLTQADIAAAKGKSLRRALLSLAFSGNMLKGPVSV